MSVIVTPTVEIQSDASATDLSDLKVPNGQTVKSYIRNNTSATGTIAKHSSVTSSCTMDRTQCVKKNGWVVVSGRLHTINPKAAANLNYFSIPTGYRPKSSTVGFAYMSVYNGSTYVGVIPLACTIDTSGNVNVTYGAAYSTDQVFFYAMYPV